MNSIEETDGIVDPIRPSKVNKCEAIAASANKNGVSGSGFDRQTSKQLTRRIIVANLPADCVDSTIQFDPLDTCRKEEPPKLLAHEANFLFMLENERRNRKIVFRRAIRGVSYTVTDIDGVQMIDPVPEIVVRLPESTRVDEGAGQVSWRLFSPELAKRINPKQPDVTAAVLIYGLLLWQNNNYAQTMINGKRHSFRSLNELLADHPYFTRSQIHSALNRAEVALKGRFQIVRNREKFYFHVDDYLKKLQAKDKLIGFTMERAVQCKVIGAVLMQNLYYQLDHFAFPKTDDAGNSYGSLSPRELSKHLPFHEDTISRALTDLRKSPNGLVRHPEDKSFYTMADSFVRSSDVPKTRQRRAAEVTSNAAEVNTCAAEVTNLLWPYSNEYSNSSCKGNITNPAEAPPVRIRELPITPSSEGLRYLKSFGEQLLQKFRNDQLSTSGVKPKVIKVKPSELPYDDVSRTDFDLPYDFIPSRRLQPLCRTRKQWLKERIEQVTLFWRCVGFKYTKRDMEQLRHFLTDNPRLPEDFFEQIHQNLNPEHNWMRLGDWSAKKGKYDCLRFLRRVKTAKALLQYLPQIIFQMFMRPEMIDGKIAFTGEIEEPFNSIDYSYLGKIPNSRLVQLNYV
ncbi:MAG: hypothetical protein ABJF10_06590 [Chthoniobacter sp.]|uniref:hypothetical protein n=1 Tax=Chthoniobacter sp. TaxID=2510640 RepID=UPI0032AAD965